jgi:uncharacterized membrane protein
MQSLLTKTWTRITAYFLTGLFAVLPLVITVAIVIWVASFVHQFLGPGTHVGRLIEQLGSRPGDGSVDWISYITGWVAVLTGLLGLGMLLVELGIRKYLAVFVNAAVSRIPLVGQVYGTSKQLVDMLDRGDDEKLKGMVPVFCYFSGNRNAGALALLVTPERFLINGREYQVVIIPTAPIPFGGGLLFMPADLLEPANISVDGLMSIYVSMGVTAPQFLATGKPEKSNDQGGPGNPHPS